jgi:hypothetical protein
METPARSATSSIVLRRFCSLLMALLSGRDPLCDFSPIIVIVDSVVTLVE